MNTVTILDKIIDLNLSEVIYDFKQFVPEDWNIIRHTPKWVVTGDAITGGGPDEPCHGQIFYKTPVKGEAILEFDAELIAPSYHDLIWWWDTRLDRDPWGDGYLGCLGGWFGNLAGIEKSPTFKPSMISPSFEIEPGRSYHIVSGTCGGVLFIAVDGKMVSFMTDPQPPDPETPGYFGFGVYESHARYRNLKVMRPYWITRELVYTPATRLTAMRKTSLNA